MVRPINRENLKSLADQLIWGIQEYIEAGIDDIKGDDWVPVDSTLADFGLVNAHSTIIFPITTGLTCTVTAHANINEWGAWVELVDSGATTLSTAFAANDGHISAIFVESTESAGQIWEVQLSYGASRTNCGSMRFISASVGFVPAAQQMRIRTAHIPAGETIYGRLMCNKAGEETATIHVRYYLHP